MGLVPPMQSGAPDDLLGQGMVPSAAPLGLEPLDSLHQLPAMENMGYDQVCNSIILKYILSFIKFE